MYIHERNYLIALARLGLSSIEVAQELGIHHTTISRWIRGWYPVPDQFRPKLSELLQIPINELFQEKEVANG